MNTLDNRLMIAVSFLLVVLFHIFRITHEVNICSTILENAARNNDVSSSLVYRCRSNDNCGGVGDRLAGIMAGAYFSITVGRALKIQWDSLSNVFEHGEIDWRFHPGIMGLSANDLVLQNGRVTEAMGYGKVVVISPQHPHIALFNDMNSRRITNASFWPILAQYKHIFFHSNRGPDLTSFQQLSAALLLPKIENHGANFLHLMAYRCIFDEIFKPTESFLNSTYKAMGQPAMEFRKVINIAQNPTFPSLAYHHRIPDKYVENDDPRGIIELRKLQWIADIGQISKKKKPQTNLFFITNSPVSAARVLESQAFRKKFRAIYIQELSGSMHINMVSHNGTTTNATASDQPSGTKSSFLQAMRDWYILKSVQRLVCGRSGFCRSAALVGSEEQLVFDGFSSSFRHIASVCSNRECI